MLALNSNDAVCVWVGLYIVEASFFVEYKFKYYYMYYSNYKPGLNIFILDVS